MPIPFTQYLRPDGRKTPVSINRPDAIEAMAQEIQAKGYSFECEELSNGICSFTVASPHEEDNGDIAIKLVRNGPGVPMAVDELVKEAYRKVCGPSELTRKRAKYPRSPRH
jgi:DNA-binding IclR family transcriptional regulator